jgi:hypothetical protein
MPSFTKPPAELAAAFSTALDRLPGAQRRQMFGQPAAFANGQMFTGLFGSNWFIRVPDDAANELLAMKGSGAFEVMPGRPMKGYVLLPPSVVEDPRALAAWLDRAFAFTSGLPPKKATAAGKKTAKAQKRTSVSPRYPGLDPSNR